jgi:DNA (cytosine-5)-methyltransferase 1
MLENVRGLLDAVFDDYRNKVEGQLEELGYFSQWRLLNASDFGVSQLRPALFLLAYVEMSWEPFLGLIRI